MLKELSRLGKAFGVGLPALAGVFLGVRLYTGGTAWSVAAVAALVFLWLVLGAGRFMATTYPRPGAWIIESWIVAPVLITAFITDLVLFLTLGDWFPAALGAASGKTLEKLTGTLVGAVTTFFALVWAKDIAEAKGYFWPSTQLQYAMDALFKLLKQRGKEPGGNTPAYNAMFMDTVPDTDIDDWSFPHRHARAKIVADYLKTL